MEMELLLMMFGGLLVAVATGFILLAAYMVWVMVIKDLTDRKE